MRIIDKNTDFYDYLQDATDTVVFDRRNSFVLSKELVCEHIYYTKHYSDSKYRFILMQACNTFWLFLLTITNTDQADKPIDYTIELLHTWKNYNKQRKLLSLDIITFNWNITLLLRTYIFKEDNKTKIIDNIQNLVNAIDMNDFEYDKSMNQYTVYRSGKNNQYIKDTKTIPLLKACGISSYIDPIVLFTSLEEYFLLEKSSLERTESIGLTNNDKIEMHGFNIKTSFRGKNK